MTNRATAPETPGMATTIFRAIWLGAAMAVLLVPGAHLLFGEIQKVSRAEKRVLTSKIVSPPHILDLKPFRSAVDAFVRDQFAFREDLFRARIEIALAVGVSPTPIVIVGRHGWLFVDINSIVRDIRGSGRLGSAHAARLVETFTRTVQEIEAHGAPVVIAIAPNKASIYPEYLPRWLRPVPDERTNLGRLMPKIRRSPYLSARTVDLLGPLRAARAHGVLYSPNDTHWNSLGAFFAYRALAARLARRLPDLKPLARRDLRFDAAPHRGDLTLLANPWGRARVVANRHPIALGAWRRYTGRFIDLAGATHRGQVLEVTAATGSGRGRTLLIVGDSFSGGMVRYFLQNFDRVVFVHHENGAWPRSVLDRFKPTAALLEIVQRTLPDYTRKP